MDFLVAQLVLKETPVHRVLPEVTQVTQERRVTQVLKAMLVHLEKWVLKD
jgi:hypothetical protein